MKMNYIPLVRPILASIAVLCLAVISFDVEPARASPPAMDNYDLKLEFEGPGKICENTPRYIKVKVKVEQIRPNDIIPLAPWKGSITVTATVGSITPPQQAIEKLWYNRANEYTFVYTPVKTGPVTLDWNVQVPGIGQVLYPLRFDVKEKSECNQKLNIRGTADMGATANALSPGSTWNFAGSYDVAGTVEMNEGSANGQGVASMFMDGVATAPQVGCEFTSPIQGDTAVEIEVDPNAWAKDGILKLQVHLEPMPVNMGGIGCSSFGTTINTGSAAVTVASFDLNFPPLPASGGSTSLEFQLPGQPGDFKMNLIVVSEEAGS